MKAVPLVLLAAAWLVAGCATRYTITLNSGSTITAYGKPKLEGNHYVYKDAHGQVAYVTAGRVREISPRNMATERINSGYSAKPIK